MINILDLNVGHALLEAKAGRFESLAQYLEEQGVDAKIATWVRSGCKTNRGRGKPPRDPHLEHRIAQAYFHYRNHVPPKVLPEQELALMLEDAYGINEREIRKIVARKKKENIVRGAAMFAITEKEAERRWAVNQTRWWRDWEQSTHD